MAQLSQLLLDFDGTTEILVGDTVSFTFNGVNYSWTAKTSAVNPDDLLIAANATEAIDALIVSLTPIAELDLIPNYGAGQLTVRAKYYGSRFNFVSPVFFFQGASIVSNLANVTLALSVTASITANQCKGVSNGAIAATIIGGEWPFTIAWREVGEPAVIDSDLNLAGLTAGSYEITVTDFAATVVSEVFVVTEPATITTVVPTITHILCNGAASGAISLAVSGGNAPYTYLWSNGATTRDVSGLVAGTYSVTVTDNNGCIDTLENLQVTQPAAIVIEATILGNGIYLAVSGGNAPYTYLWSNGATTKDITNLAPGTYSVTVTDDNDCQQSVSIDIADFRFFFSQNPIGLELAAVTPESKPNLSFINEVYIQESYPNGAFRLIATEEHLSDADGATVFQGESYLDAYLTSYIPAVDLNALVRADGMFKIFRYRHTEKFGEPPVEASYIQVDANVVLLGGLSDIEYAASSFFASYLATKKPFLNWNTLEKTVLPNQPDYLYYLVNSFSESAISVKVKVYYDDETEQTITKYTENGILSRYEVYCFPVGFAQLNLSALASDKTVISYDVWVEDQLNAIVSEVRSFTIDYDYYPFQRFILYLSSLGGMTTLALTGKASKEVKMTQEVIEKNLGHMFSILDLGQQVTFSKGEPVIDFASGYIIDQEAFERLEDFIQSEEFYLLDKDRWIPVRVEADSTPIYDETRQDAMNAVKGKIYLPTQRRFTPRL